MPFLTPFFGWEGPPTKNRLIAEKSWYPYSKLSTGGPIFSAGLEGRLRVAQLLGVHGAREAAHGAAGAELQLRGLRVPGGAADAGPAPWLSIDFA